MPYCFYICKMWQNNPISIVGERKKKKLQMPNQMRPREENQQKLRLREQDFRGTQKSTSTQWLQSAKCTNFLVNQTLHRETKKKKKTPFLFQQIPRICVKVYIIYIISLARKVVLDTIVVDILMQEGEDTWCNVIGEVDWGRLGLTGHLKVLLQISKQKPVGVAGETLLSQAPLQRLRPHPHPTQHYPRWF